MKIIIVGAGIGGLSAAIALAQPPRRHTIILLESAPQLAEVGAGVQLGPNATRLWQAWGMGQQLLAKAARPQGLYVHRWQDGKLLAHTTIAGEFEEKYGAPYVVVHRAEVHEMLYRRAVELGVPVRVASRVVEYDFERGKVTLESGELLCADLVVAVDGINSFARKQFLGDQDLGAEKTGWAAFRMMVDVQRIKEDPDIAWLVSKPDLHLWVGDGHSAMTYMVSGASALNMVLSHPDDINTTGWTSEQMMREIQNQFTGWDPRLEKLIAMMRPNPQNWPTFQVRPLSPWVSKSGKFLLMGDAVHAMAFYLSMGVALAVEDSAALAVCLDYVESGKLTIHEALSEFESSRMSRTNAIKQASLDAGGILHLPEGDQQKTRDAAMEPNDEGETTGENPYGLTDPHTREWCYGYDAEEETKKALEEKAAA